MAQLSVKKTLLSQLPVSFAIGDTVLLSNGYVGTVKFNRHPSAFGVELNQKHPNGGSGILNGTTRFECKSDYGFFTLSSNIKAKLDLNPIDNTSTLTLHMDRGNDVIRFPTFSELRRMHKATSTYVTFGYSRDIGTHVPTSVVELCIKYNSYQPFINDTIKLNDGQIGRIWCVGTSTISNQLYFGITFNNSKLSRFHPSQDISKVFEYDAITGHAISDLTIGQTVALSSTQETGTIKYIGKVHDIDACVGIEFNARSLLNTHNGKQYFDCATECTCLFVYCNEAKVPINPDQLPQYVRACFTEDKAMQLSATTYIRKLLSIASPPIQAIVDSGVLPRLVEFLTYDHFEELQHQAVWAVGNITSGSTEDTAAVIQQGAVPIFVTLLDSTSNDVKEEALRSLSNIAGDNSECSDLVLSCGVLNKLMPLFHSASATMNTAKQPPISLLQKATWAVSNLCRGCPPQEYTELILKALSIMMTSKDEEILSDACWALSYLTDPQNSKQYVTQHIEMITGKASLNDTIYQRLIDLLLHSSAHVRHPALRSIGNIVSNHEASECVMNSGVLQRLSKLFRTETNKPIKRELCWTLSNITAGSTDQIEAVIAANLIPSLIHALQSKSFEVSKEAAWAISNATVTATDTQIQCLVQNGALDALCRFCMKAPGNGKHVAVALEAIQNIWTAGLRLNANGLCSIVFSDVVEKCGGVRYLEKIVLQDNVEWDVKNKAVSLLDCISNDKSQASKDSVNAKERLPVVARHYVCFKCLAVGEHWIMQCEFVSI